MGAHVINRVSERRGLPIAPLTAGQPRLPREPGSCSSQEVRGLSLPACVPGKGGEIEFGKPADIPERARLHIRLGGEPGQTFLEATDRKVGPRGIAFPEFVRMKIGNDDNPGSWPLPRQAPPRLHRLPQIPYHAGGRHESQATADASIVYSFRGQDGESRERQGTQCMVVVGVPRRDEGVDGTGEGFQVGLAFGNEHGLGRFRNPGELGARSGVGDAVSVSVQGHL